jgi:hypothetical protein
LPLSLRGTRWRRLCGRRLLLSAGCDADYQHRQHTKSDRPSRHGESSVGGISDEIIGGNGESKAQGSRRRAQGSRLKAQGGSRVQEVRGS